MSYEVCLCPGADLAGFRRALRQRIAAEVPPDQAVWSCAPQLFAEEGEISSPALSLPRQVAEQIPIIVCHTDPDRYALLYQLVWRLRHGEPNLPAIHSDPLIHRLHRLERNVRRDLHKMHAYVRFRRTDMEGRERFVAWFEPEHFIVEATAEFFIDRFRSLDWSILTPKGSLHWDRTELVVGPPASRSAVPAQDPFEEGWRSYYEGTFNPARLNTELMRSHMAKKYWHNLPEARSIARLVHSAHSRVTTMIEQDAHVSRKRDPAKAVARMQDQEPKTLAALNNLIQASAPMVKGGTRAVLGEGPLHPDIALVGEQPGDQEDIEGHPFVGPAGKLLNRALADAGIDRTKVYVTNAVKHFKFELRGKRRLHARPNAGEVKHYRWWLEKELDLVKPRIIVALGATAIFALTGKALPVTANRGPAIFDGRTGFITIHPSFLLRIPEEDERHRAFLKFVADLRAASEISEVKTVLRRK